MAVHAGHNNRFQLQLEPKIKSESFSDFAGKNGTKAEVRLERCLVAKEVVGSSLHFNDAASGVVVSGPVIGVVATVVCFSHLLMFAS